MIFLSMSPPPLPPPVLAFPLPAARTILRFQLFCIENTPATPPNIRKVVSIKLFKDSDILLGMEREFRHFRSVSVSLSSPLASFLPSTPFFLFACKFFIDSREPMLQGLHPRPSSSREKRRREKESISTRSSSRHCREREGGGI